MDKASLIAEITVAFDGVSREDGVTIHQTDALDYYYGDPERQAAGRAKDTDTRWQDIPEDLIRFEQFSLSFLDPKGFRYYLPAYMTCYLKYLELEDEETATEDEARKAAGEVPPVTVTDTWVPDWSDSILFHLGVGHPSAFEDDDYHRPRFTILSPEQSRAVAHFLEFLADEEERQDLIARATKGTISEEERFRLEKLELWNVEERLALDRYWGQFL